MRELKDKKAAKAEIDAGVAALKDLKVRWTWAGGCMDDEEDDDDDDDEEDDDDDDEDDDGDGEEYG